MAFLACGNEGAPSCGKPGILTYEYKVVALGVEILGGSNRVNNPKDMVETDVTGRESGVLRPALWKQYKNRIR